MRGRNDMCQREIVCIECRELTVVDRKRQQRFVAERNLNSICWEKYLGRRKKLKRFKPDSLRQRPQNYAHAVWQWLKCLANQIDKPIEIVLNVCVEKRNKWNKQAKQKHETVLPAAANKS